jgi:hypothetical protein
MFFVPKKEIANAMKNYEIYIAQRVVTIDVKEREWCESLNEI